MHFAIEKHMEEKCISFLLKLGADPHIEDETGMTCCDKAQHLRLYKHLKVLNLDDKVKRRKWQGPLKKPSGQFSIQSRDLSGTGYSIKD